MASVGDAHAALVRATEEQYAWETRLAQARALVADILKIRLEIAELNKVRVVHRVCVHVCVRWCSKVAQAVLGAPRLVCSGMPAYVCQAYDVVALIVVAAIRPIVQARHNVPTLLVLLLQAGYDTSPGPKGTKPDGMPIDESLPDHVILTMLRREVGGCGWSSCLCVLIRGGRVWKECV